ncbi:hypothetical protein B0H16DRAFT_437898 [Mycena metata]|uniref:Uncharacterized protein n=1 Tax=Mycena metata TaxID=1033252 RepID=A0AAD7HD05_9AGAR|nr:hypothetical protein B0H16DRAFT_437898 [Mycena metata]
MSPACPSTSLCFLLAHRMSASEDVLVPYTEILRQECPRCASTLLHVPRLTRRSLRILVVGKACRVDTGIAAHR